MEGFPNQQNGVTRQEIYAYRLGRRQAMGVALHWVFSILKYITKVKLLFLYIFYVLYVLFHYKPLSGDGGRVRPHFYVLG